MHIMCDLGVSFQSRRARVRVSLDLGIEWGLFEDFKWVVRDWEYGVEKGSSVRD